MGKKQSNPPPPKGAIKPPPPTSPPPTTAQRIADGIEQSNAIARHIATVEKESAMITATPRDHAIRALHEHAPFVSALLETVRGMQVRDDDECATMAKLRKDLNAASAKLKARKKSITDPLSAVVKAVNELFKPSETQLEDALAATQQKLNRYAQDQLVIEGQRKRAALDEAREQEARAAADAAKLRAAGAGETAEIVEVQAAAAVAMASGPGRVAAVKTDDVTFSVRMHWIAGVLDVKTFCGAVAGGRVPEACVNINLRALNEHAKFLGEPLVAVDPSLTSKVYIGDGFAIQLKAEGATR